MGESTGRNATRPPASSWTRKSRRRRRGSKASAARRRRADLLVRESCSAQDTKTVAKLWREYAQRTALRGGNPYRAKAYSRAADSLARLAEPLGGLIKEDRLTEIPGVGEAIADIITKLHHTGTRPSLEKLRQEIPAGVLEILTVPGLRPEKVLRTL